MPNEIASYKQEVICVLFAHGVIQLHIRLTMRWGHKINLKYYIRNEEELNTLEKIISDMIETKNMELVITIISCSIMIYCIQGSV